MGARNDRTGALASSFDHRLHAFHSVAAHLDREINQQDCVLGHDPHQHQDADQDGHGERVLRDDQANRHTTNRERQRQQDGEGLDHVLEQQDQHDQDQQQTEQHGVAEALRHFRLNLGIAALGKTNGWGQLRLVDDPLELVGCGV
jgi:hypothetical protein